MVTKHTAKKKTKTPTRRARAWLPSDNRLAEKEGWAVFDCYGGLQEIEADNDSRRFKRKGIYRDDLAVKHVCKRALAGSRLHIRALVVHSQNAVDVFKAAYGYGEEDTIPERHTFNAVCVELKELYDTLKTCADMLGITDDPAASRQGELADKVRAMLRGRNLRPGDRVISLLGEWDEDENGKERATGPNATGEIRGFADDHYEVAFANGTHVRITPEEIADPTQYTLLVQP